MIIEQRHCWLLVLIAVGSIVTLALSPRLLSNWFVQDAIPVKHEMPNLAPRLLPERSIRQSDGEVTMKFARQKPLFNSNRLPFVAPIIPTEQLEIVDPAAEVPIVEDLLSIPQSAILRGVRIAKNQRTALIDFNGDNQAQWYAEGSIVYNWLLLTISAEQIQLQNQGRNFEIKLYVDNTKLPIGDQPPTE